MLLVKEYGSDSACHRRFQQWVKLNIFKKIWAKLLEEYDYKEGKNGCDGNHLIVYQ
jgi:hypothetical protein